MSEVHKVCKYLEVVQCITTSTCVVCSRFFILTRFCLYPIESADALRGWQRTIATISVYVSIHQTLVSLFPVKQMKYLEPYLQGRVTISASVFKT